MPRSAKTNDERQFAVHTVGGEKITVTASRFDVKKGLNRLHFIDAKGKVMKEWVFFLSGLAAVYPEPQSQSQPDSYPEADRQSYTQQNY